MLHSVKKGEKIYMSRVAKKKIIVPKDIKIKIKKNNIKIKKENTELEYKIHKFVKINFNNENLTFSVKKNIKDHWKQAGTTRSIVQSMIVGLTTGFTKKLFLVGIGYKTLIKNDKLILYLGFSHEINYKIPKNVTIQCPSQTEITINGVNKQIVGQIAAKLRSYRPPEPYKGKGIFYINETIKIKETKKK